MEVSTNYRNTSKGRALKKIQYFKLQRQPSVKENGNKMGYLCLALAVLHFGGRTLTFLAFLGDLELEAVGLFVLGLNVEFLPELLTALAQCAGA